MTPIRTYTYCGMTTCSVAAALMMLRYDATVTATFQTYALAQEKKFLNNNIVLVSQTF